MKGGININTLSKSLFDVLIKLGAAAYLLLAIYLFKNNSGSGLDTYVIGELLINYECGYIRRGLLGSFLFYVANISGSSLYVIIQKLVLFLYFIFLLWFVIKLWRKPLVLFAFAAAPMGFFFLGNTVSAVGRKEIFLFYILLFSFFIISHTRGLVLWLGILVLFLLGYLIHESYLLLYWPWVILAYFYKHHKFSLRQQIWDKTIIGQWLFLYLFAGLFFLLTQYWNNNGLKEKTACLHEQYQTLSLEKKYDSIAHFIFTWPISWLEKDLNYGFQATSVIYKTPDVRQYWAIRFLIFGVLILLILYHTNLWQRISGFFRKGFYALFLVIPLAGGVIAQFFIALDWGRFLHIVFINLHVFLICFCWKPQATTQPNRYYFSGVLLFVLTVISSFYWIPHIYAGGPLMKSYMEGMLQKFIELIFH